MSLKLTMHENHGVTVIAASGRITLGEETRTLRNTLKSILADGKSRIVLLLNGVDYVDSSGLGTLVSLCARANARDATIRLAGVTKLFRELLIITKLMTVFDIHGSEAEAVASFPAAAGA